jgi:hypothetical protein
MTALREAVQEFVADLVADNDCGGCGHFQYYAELFCHALAQQVQGPVAWTDRELELIDGMIEVQLRHAAQCDAIANRPMAERQKGWDMERVALLQKIKSNPPRREWRGLTEEEREQATGWSVEHIEAALKEKNQ